MGVPYGRRRAACDSGGFPKWSCQSSAAMRAPRSICPEPAARAELVHAQQPFTNVIKFNEKLGGVSFRNPQPGAAHGYGDTHTTTRIPTTRVRQSLPRCRRCRRCLAATSVARARVAAAGAAKAPTAAAGAAASSAARSVVARSMHRRRWRGCMCQARERRTAATSLHTHAFGFRAHPAGARGARARLDTGHNSRSRVH